jgi:hypothetical protein
MSHHLVTASERGDVTKVAALIGQGADPDWMRKGGGHRPLTAAISQGHLPVLELLIEHGADVNAYATVGYTPLMFAAFTGDVTAARLLIKAGADVNLQAHDSEDTALHHAVRAPLNAVEFTELLLSVGARVDLKDVWQRTALDVALESNSPDCAALLRDQGAMASTPEEPHTIEWPQDDGASLNELSPELVVYRFVTEMSEWETSAHAALAQDLNLMPQLLTQGDRIVERYAVQGDRMAQGSIGSPPRYSPEQRLVSVDARKTLAEVVLRDSREMYRDQELRFHLRRTECGWRLDKVQERGPLDHGKWQRGWL